MCEKNYISLLTKLSISKASLLIFIPIIYLITELVSPIIIIKIIVSFLLLYIYNGILGLNILKKLFSKNTQLNNYFKLQPYIILHFGSVLLIGLFISLIIGILQMFFFPIYTPISYFCYSEVLAFIYMYLAYFKLKKDNSIFDKSTYKLREIDSIFNFFGRFIKDKINIKNLKSILLLIIILLPSISFIIRDIKQMDLIYAESWDLLKYTGDAISVIIGRFKFLYGNTEFFGWMFYRPLGYPIIIANEIGSSGITPGNITIYFKISHILFMGLTNIWIYLIIYKITKNKVISIIGPIFAPVFMDHMALGMIYLVPSSLAIQIGLCYIYINLIFYDKKNDLTKSTKISIIFINVFFLFFIFMIHFFIAVLIVLAVIIINLYKIRFIKKHEKIVIFFLILLGALLFLFRIWEPAILVDILNYFIPSSSHETIEENIYYLKTTNNILLIIFNLIISLLIIFKKNIKYFTYKGLYLLYPILLLVYFAPIHGTYRILCFFYYITLIIYCKFFTITLKIFSDKQILNYVQRNFSEFSLKINNLLKLIRKRKYFHLLNKKYKSIVFLSSSVHFLQIFIIVMFSFLVFPISLKYYTLYEIPPKMIIIDDQTNNLYRSQYSTYEYQASCWVYDNVDVKKYIALTDIGTGRVIYAFSGLKFFSIINESFRNVFLQANNGFNITNLVNQFISYETNYVENYTNLNLLLIVSLRTDYMIKFDKFIAHTHPHINLNTTLREILNDYTPGLQLIYNNKEVYIYNITLIM